LGAAGGKRVARLAKVFNRLFRLIFAAFLALPEDGRRAAVV
jgi:hypothetical protein